MTTSPSNAKASTTFVKMIFNKKMTSNWKSFFYVQILIYRAKRTPRRCLVGKFCSSFFKSSSEPPRSAVAPRKARNSLPFESATEGVNGKPQAWQRGGPLAVGSTSPWRSEEPHKWGVPLSTQSLFKSLIRFFLWQ